MREALAGDVADVSGVLADAWRADVALGALGIFLICCCDFGEVVETLFGRTAGVEMLRSLFARTLRRLF